MPYSIKELLVLPAEEKLALADLLYSSVNEELNEDESEVPWFENEEFLKELDRRVTEWQQGKAKGYTLKEVKNFMQEQKSNYKHK